MTRAIENPFASLERTANDTWGKKGGREKQFREKFREIAFGEGEENRGISYRSYRWILFRITWRPISGRNNILNGLLFNREFLLHEGNLVGHDSNSNVMEVTGKLFFPSERYRERERGDKTTAWILYEFRIYMIPWNHWNGSCYHYAFIYKIVRRFAHKFALIIPVNIYALLKLHLLQITR